MIKLKILIPYILVFLLLPSALFAQETKDVLNMTKSEVLKLSYEELTEFDLADLMQMAEIVGVSTDELLELAIVSASKKEESLFDAPLGASVLTRDMIKKAGATSIMEALRLVPGVIVREQTPGNYDIHLRGFDAIDPNALINFTTNSLTLIMINNRIVYNEFQGNTYWELLQVSVDDVERIEVVRGPAAALYGPNAVTGMINVITRNPNDKQGLQVSSYSQAGTPQFHSYSAGVGYNGDGPFSFRMSGQYDLRERHNVDYYVLGPQLTFGANGAPVTDADGNLVMTPPGFVDKITETTLNVAGRFPLVPDRPSTETATNVDERYPDPEKSYDRYSYNGHVNFHKGAVDMNLMGGYAAATVQKAFAVNNMAALSADESYNGFAHLWGTVNNWSVSADFNQGKIETLGNGSSLRATYDIANAEVLYDYNIGENLNIKPGVSYRYASFYGRILGSEKLDENYNLVEDEGDKVNTTLSGFVRAEYKWNKFRFIGALRADKFKYPDEVHFSPQVIGTYKVNDGLMFRASYGHAVRSPFMINLFTNLHMKYPVNPTPAAVLGYLQSKGLPSDLKFRYDMVYLGTENQNAEYDLLSTNEFEVGTRFKLNQWLSVDAEVFFQELNGVDVFNKVATGFDASGIMTKQELVKSDTISFITPDMKPQQFGSTVTVFGKPAEKIDFQVFATFQTTKVKDYYVLDENGFVKPGETTDLEHENTPAWFGGFNVNYNPISKLHLNLNGYFYGEQTLKMSNGVMNIPNETVDGNLILNGVVGYDIFKGGQVFINVKNFATGEKRQFALTDKIGATYLVGINIDL